MTTVNTEMQPSGHYYYTFCLRSGGWSEVWLWVESVGRVRSCVFGWVIEVGHTRSHLSQVSECGLGVGFTLLAVE